MIFEWNTLLKVKSLLLRNRWNSRIRWFGEKLVATSRKFNSNCAFRYSLTVMTKERYIPVEVFAEYKCFFLNPEKLRWGKKRVPKNRKKVQLFISLIKYFNGFLNFYFFTFFFGKWKKASQIIEKGSKIFICFLFVRGRIFFELKEPTCHKTLNFVDKSFFLVLEYKNELTRIQKRSKEYGGQRESSPQPLASYLTSHTYVLLRQQQFCRRFCAS